MLKDRKSKSPFTHSIQTNNRKHATEQQTYFLHSRHNFIVILLLYSCFEQVEANMSHSQSWRS